MTRSSLISFHGKISYYQLYQNDEPILYTKVNTLKPNGICYVSEGADFNSKQNKYLGAILFANNRTTFSVRRNSELGEEIMRIIVIFFIISLKKKKKHFQINLQR